MRRHCGAAGTELSAIGISYPVSEDDGGNIVGNLIAPGATVIGPHTVVAI